MLKPKQVILIPYWVKEILERNQLNLNACLEFEKIKPLMALNDLVSFAALQSHGAKITGEGQLTGSLISVWINSIPEGNRDVLEYLTNNVCRLESDASFNNEVVERLFTAEAKLAYYEKPFITYDLTPEVCGVVIYPGFFTDKPNTELQQDVIEAILKVLYVYNTYGEVAQLPLFKRYLELLSQKKIIV